ncbi:MAG: PIN domain-containing protein [Halobacteriales archaeon]
MKVLDATFLIDYLNGEESTKEFYEAKGGESERWVLPIPAYAEALVGEGNFANGDIDGARVDLEWTEKYEVDTYMAVIAAEIADEIGPQGPDLTGHDALIAAVGRHLDAPVVSADTDLTHEETKRTVDIEEYR